MAQKKAVLLEEKTVEKQVVSPKKTLLKTVVSKDAASQEVLAGTPKAKHIGDVLKIVRESKGYSIKDISAVLRIGEHYLRAIEKMNADRLPEEVYTLGFVRSYASYLGIDFQKSVTQFKSEIFSVAQAKKLAVPKPVETPALPTQKILWGTLIALLITLAVGYVYLGKGSFALEDDVPHVLKPVETRDTLTPSLIEPDFGEPLFESENQVESGE